MSHDTQITELHLAEVMGERFGRYSKYIIQERALPDIRDGLKPVQRRILFAMYRDHNTSDKAFRKSAKTVGNVIGNYHPHGDSSVYEAMVRMSQYWKLNHELIEMHGNNGSMDGDPPAAMRYTEARLSRISGELLKDIDKKTVPHVLNFDDTLEEPTVLPAGFPQLLVNGATGISAGYATDIPPHNLAEVIDATIQLIDHPKTTLKDLLKIIKGPDFPTGGIIQGKKDLLHAYQTGKGKVVLRSKTQIEDLKGKKQQIVIDEIPYEINKSNLVKRIDYIRINKQIDGIADVRDESDRNGLRIVIELKKDVNAEGVLQYLLKKTDLQVNYNFNMVAINDQKPDQVGLINILSAYITFKADVIRKRTQFELQKAQTRLHIVDGLIKALSILDEVIQTIRDSENKSDAKVQLVKQYDFTNEQAEAIVTLQLYRLTNTDITALQSERLDLNESVAYFESILTNSKTLHNVMKKELRDVKKTYQRNRLTSIEDEVEELIIDKEILVPEEDVKVVITETGYYKRTTLRSAMASAVTDLGLKDGDYPIFVKTLSTLDNLVLFTDKGNYLYIPVHDLPDLKWKELGLHLSQKYALEPNERVLLVSTEKDLSDDTVLFLTREGQVKLTEGSQFSSFRGDKVKSSKAMKLKTASDVITTVSQISKKAENSDLAVITHRGLCLRFNISEIPIVGTNASGVKAANLKKDDFIISGVVIPSDSNHVPVVMLTQRGSLKKIDITTISRLSRAKRGLMVLKELKSDPHRLIAAFPINQSTGGVSLIVKQQDGTIEIDTNDLNYSTRTSNGSFVDDLKDKPILSVSVRDTSLLE